MPTCAQEPTRAWESIIVSSSTYAPMLTYIGGMPMTPRPRKEPSRTDEPPGTMRTPAATSRRFRGSVSLSKNGHAAVVHGGVGQLAEAEAQEDSLLDPGVHLPAGGGNGVGLGRAGLAARERLAKLDERRACRIPVGGSARGEQPLDAVAQGEEGFAHARAPAGTRPTPASTRRSLSRVSGPGGTIGNR